MTTFQALTIVVALLVTDVFWGTISFVQLRLRERRGRGPSPLPPMLFPFYLYPTFAAKSSLLFNQSGYGILRIIDSVVTAAALVGLSITIAGIVPWWLSNRLSRVKESSKDFKG